MQKKFKVLSLIIFVFMFIFAAIYGLHALSVGQAVGSLKLINPDDNPKWIPGIGSKVVTIMYTDPDVKDINDPLSDAIKAKNYPKAKYQGIGIANCKDTWIPNAGIRMAARKKEKQFKGSVILLDEDRTVSTKWGLGDCDGAAVVIVVGKDKKVKFVKKIKNKGQSKGIIAEVLKILDEETKK